MPRCLLLLLIFAIAGCSKPKKEMTKTTKKDRSIVATLSEITNKVETKRKNALSWSTAVLHFGFENYDRVKTDSNSQAQVLFRDHSQLLLEENTMAIIIDRIKNEQEDKSIINIDQGKIRGNILKSAHLKKKITFKSKKEEVTLESLDGGDVPFSYHALPTGEVKVKTSKNLKVETQKKTIILTPKRPSIQLGTQEQTKELKPFYKLDYPVKDITTDQSHIIVRGSGYDYKILLNGQEIKFAQHFEHKVNLTKGINILTFQFLHREESAIKVIKVNRI